MRVLSPFSSTLNNPILLLLLFVIIVIKTLVKVQSRWKGFHLFKWKKSEFDCLQTLSPIFTTILLCTEVQQHNQSRMKMYSKGVCASMAMNIQSTIMVFSWTTKCLILTYFFFFFFVVLDINRYITEQYFAQS